MTPAAPFANSIAVIIGINEYGNGIATLRTARNDAERLGSLLGEEHGYTVVSLLDADASQDAITTLLTRELPARIGPDDRVFFYFAGHGVARDSDDGPSGYLLPSDARRGDESTYLHMPLVHDALLSLPCRHMLVVLDSCFSGAFRWSGTRDAEEVSDVIHQEKYDRFVRDPAWQVITSASQDQKALDQLSAGALGSRDGDGAHSPFALALFDALGGAGDLVPKGVGDGLLTATELYLYLDETLQNAVIEAGKRQTPRLWPLKKHDKGEFVFFVPGRDLALPPAPPLTFENNPWRSLASYDTGNATLFFGRDAETAALRAAIETQPLTVVLGASGTGKSSLVKAGVLPRLVADGWDVLPVIRPGSAPLVALGQSLATDTSAAPAVTPETIAARIAERVASNAGRKMAIVIDQFEELITLVRSDEERDRMLALLAQLVTTHADALRIIVTIRTDFEPNFDAAGFGDAWRNGRFVVPPMSRENLRAVIEKPAAARVLYFEPSNLVETLLDEVVATPGALPLLSFALSEMYIAYVRRQSADRAITRADYDALGGVVGALRARAESEYEALDPAHRETLRRVMLRMVTAEGGGVARRRVMDAELDFADNDEAARAAAVVDRLTAARLLVEGKEPDGEAFVEPAHDALVRGWGRLLQWVREENEAKFPLSQQQRLARSADDWHRADDASKAGLLWSDSSRSAQLAPLVRRKSPWLNRRELAFAQRSIRGRRLAIATTAGAVLTIAVAGVAAIIGGRRASARAEQVRVSSIVNTAQSMVSEDPLLAGLLLGSLDSNTVQDADDATRLTMLGVATALRAQPRVLSTFGTVGEEMTAADVSHDGRLVVTATWLRRMIRIWNSDGSGTPRMLPEVPGVPTTAIFSHDDRLVAAGGEEGWVKVWHLDGSAPPTIAPSRIGLRILRLEFSPDDRRLLINYDEGRAELMDLDRPGPPYPVIEAESHDAAFGADGSQVLMLQHPQEPLLLLHVTDRPSADAPAAPRIMRRYRMPGAITRMTVSPDRRRVALGSTTGDIRIYPIETGASPLIFDADTGDAIASLAWSRDGSRLSSTSEASITNVWDAASGRLMGQMRRIEEPMQSAEFSPDMQQIVTTSPYNFQALVWTMGKELPMVLAGQTQRLVNAVFSRDARHLLTASFDGSARFWELPSAPFYNTQAQPPRFADNVEQGQSATTAAFSPDGRQLALGNNNGEVWLFSTDDPANGRRLPRAILPAAHLEFSPDGAQLHAIGLRGDRTTWQLSPPDSGTRLLPGDTLPSDLQVMRVTGGTGRRVVAFLNDGSANVIALDSPTPRRRLTRFDPSSYCVAFRRDAARLAYCMADSTVHLENADGTGTGRTIRHAGAQPQGVAFSHEGTQLAIGFGNGTVRVYGDTPSDTGRLLTGHATRVRELSFSRDDRLLLTNSDDGTVRIWDLKGTRETVVIRPRGALVADAQFTPDGRRLLTRGLNELDARIWNADGTGGYVSIPVGGATVTLTAVSPDGRWLLAATEKATAQLFPLDPADAIRPYRSINAACLSADDRARYLLESVNDARRRYAACETVRRPAVTP